MKIIERYPAPVFIDVNEPLHYPKPYSEAVCEYQIENSLINSNGYILKGFKIYKEPIAFTHREDLVFKNIISFYLKKRKRTELPVISMLHGWSDNFYHFTLECLPKLYVLKEHLSNSLVLFPKELKQFHKDWIDILELKNVILVSDNQIVSSPLSISCTFTSQSLYHHPIIIPEFKNWVLSKLKRSNKFNFKKVFIGRKANWRVILNFDEVKVFLNGLGFDYIEMEDYSVFEAVQPVKRTPLKKWISRGQGGKYVIKRLKNADEVLTPAALQKMKKVGDEPEPDRLKSPRRIAELKSAGIIISPLWILAGISWGT